jgi:hypothetical protein
MKLPTAKDLQRKIVEIQSDKAAIAQKAQQAADAEKQALIDRISKPSGLTDDQVIDKVTVIINRAVENGLTKVQVFQFPNHLCTDNGRAIDQREPGWEDTLTGIPKEILEFWKRCLQPHGYRLSYEIVDFSSGVRGDVGIILSWD